MEMMGGGGMMEGSGMMGMGTVDAPSPEETETLLDYLRSHAMLPATPPDPSVGDPAQRGVFEAVCSQCHTLPSPSMHAPQEWPAVVARMQGNTQLMRKGTLRDNDRGPIIAYLQTASTR